MYKDILLCDKSKTSKFINLIISLGITSILLFCNVSFFICPTSSKHSGSISCDKKKNIISIISLSIIFCVKVVVHIAFTRTEMLLLSKYNTVKAEQPDMLGNVFNLLDSSIILSTFRNSPNGGNISN